MFCVEKDLLATPEETIRHNNARHTAAAMAAPWSTLHVCSYLNFDVTNEDHRYWTNAKFM